MVIHQFYNNKRPAQQTPLFKEDKRVQGNMDQCKWRTEMRETCMKIS